jgi:hypothetical protein
MWRQRFGTVKQQDQAIFNKEKKYNNAIWRLIEISMINSSRHVVAVGQTEWSQWTEIALQE